MNRHRRNMVAGALAALALTATGGCGDLLGLPKFGVPVDLYTLTPKTTFDTGLPKVNWQLIVEPPVAAGGLDTARIALQHTPYTLEYYAKSAWTDNAPAMIQTLIVASFERSGAIVAVGRETIGLRPDYMLKTELREFQAVYYDGDGKIPKIVVRINAKLVEMPTRRIIANRTILKEEKAASADFKDIIDAFDIALGRALKEIVTFALTSPGHIQQPTAE